MSQVKAYLDLCRVSNLPTVWTNVLAAGLLSAGQLTPDGYLLLAASLSCFYVAGMSFNDVCDFEHDRLKRAKRPIPAGRVTLSGARWLTLALFAAGFLLLAAAPHWQGLAAGVALLLAIAAYDLRHKGNPYSVLLMASCRLLLFLVTSLALTGQSAPLVLAAGGVQFAYVVAISLVARHENQRPEPFSLPVVPAMIAGISLVDGLLLAALYGVPWLLAGITGAGLTWVGQRFVRGD